jgi:hypothetical protein
MFEGRPLTTRGRWINPLVLMHLSLMKRLPKCSAVTEPIFIVGMGRTGTTVLGLVLSMHKDAGFLNEPKALWHAVHPGDDLTGSFTDRACKYRLVAEDASPEVVQNAHRLYGAFLSESFSGRVVDKYPELIFRVPFVKAIFPDAKFLCLVRNGRDTCMSIDRWSRRFGRAIDGDICDWWGRNRRKWYLLVDQLVPEHPDLRQYAKAMRNWTRQLDMAAVEWIITMRQGLDLLRERPSEVMEIRFEQLCNESSQTIGRICEFLQLPEDANLVQYARSTLEENMPTASFTLNSEIDGPFKETMKALGYEY